MRCQPRRQQRHAGPVGSGGCVTPSSPPGDAQDRVQRAQCPLARDHLDRSGSTHRLPSGPVAPPGSESGALTAKREAAQLLVAPLGTSAVAAAMARK